MKLNDIFEARSNPDKNIKEHSLVDLMKYEGQKDVFVSFTSGFDFHDGAGGRARQKFKHNKGQNKIGMNPRSNFGTPLGIYVYPVDYVIDYSKRKGKIDGPFTGSQQWRYLYVLRRTTTHSCDSTTDFKPYTDKLREFATGVIGQDATDTIMGNAISTAFIRDNPMSVFWNNTRLLADNFVNDEVGFGNSPTVAWNVIMRKIGIDLFVDDKGESIIHSNEPTQGVFFTTQAFRVADVIERNTDQKRYNGESLLREIKSRRLNVNAISPLMFKSVIGEKIDVDDLNWLSEKMGAIQKRIVNEQITSWPIYLPFTTDSVDALRKFGKLSIDVLIQAGKRNKTPLRDYPEILGKIPSRKEWKEIFRNFSRMENVLDDLKAPWVDGKFLALAALNSFSFSSLLKCAENNNLLNDDTFVSALFVNYPQDTLDSYPDREWSFADWYRAMRANRHNQELIAGDIPLKYAMPMLLRDNSRVPPTELVKRLLREEPKFLLTYLCKSPNGKYVEPFDELETFIAENFSVIARNNPDLIENLGGNNKATAMIIAAIWRSVARGDERALRMVENAIGRGWISQDDFKKHLCPLIAPAVREFKFRGEKIDPELLVDTAVMRGRLNELDDDNLLMLIRRHPKAALSWHGTCEPDLALKIWKEYPDMRPNVISCLEVEQLYELFKSGEDIYKDASDRDKLLIIAYSCNSDPTTFSKLNDPNGPFTPLPTSRWDRYIDVKSLIQGGCFGAQVSDGFARFLLKNYSLDEFSELQLIVSRSFMVSFADEFAAFSVKTHPFGNPIPEDILTPAQISFFTNTMGWSISNNLAERAQEILSLMVKPTPATIKYVEQWLKDQQAKN